MLSTALEEINRSDLPASTCRNALQLLAMAHADNGHVMITWDDLSGMWGVSVGRSRKHLGAMQAANVLHYSSNGDGIVYVNFKAWARAHARKTSTDETENARGSDEKRAWARAAEVDATVDDQEARVDARKTSTDETKNARGRAKNDHYLTRAGAPVLTDRLTDQNDPTSNVSQSVTAPPLDERRQSETLLRDIRIPGRDAARIALAHPYSRVRDAVAAWWMNRKSAGGKLENSPGIVLYWLNNWPDKPPNHYDDAAWRKEDLYLRHRTPQEVAAADSGGDDDEAERRRKYIPDEFSDIAIG